MNIAELYLFVERTMVHALLGAESGNFCTNVNLL